MKNLPTNRLISVPSFAHLDCLVTLGVARVLLVGEDPISAEFITYVKSVMNTNLVLMSLFVFPSNKLPINERWAVGKVPQIRVFDHGREVQRLNGFTDYSTLTKVLKVYYGKEKG